MIRFIDLRGQVFNDDDLPEAEREPLFAFYDTVTSRFLTFSRSQVWSSAGAFGLDHATEKPGSRCWPLARFTSLMPEWARKDSP